MADSLCRGRPMIDRHKKLLNIIFLLLFVVVAVSINLFHTENGAGQDPLCPACTFLHSTVATVQLVFHLQLTFVLIEIVKGIELFEHDTVMLASISARAPPAD